MRTIEIEKTKSLSDYTNNLITDPIIITKKGKPYAAIVSTENIDDETLKLSLDKKFNAIISKSRKSIKNKGGISLKKIKQKFKLKI